MKTALTKGMSIEKKEEIRKSFLSSLTTRNRIIELIKEKIETSHKKRISEEGYAQPNWAYYQADSSGYERACNEIISLLSDK
jgi:hypothetical protein